VFFLLGLCVNFEELKQVIVVDHSQSFASTNVEDDPNKFPQITAADLKQFLKGRTKCGEHLEYCEEQRRKTANKTALSTNLL
jgi:hypothetical protein